MTVIFGIYWQIPSFLFLQFVSGFATEQNSTMQLPNSLCEATYKNDRLWYCKQSDVWELIGDEAD